MKLNNELQIEIDDVYACGGNCPGCVLESSERKTNSPDMNPSTLNLSLNRLLEYVKALNKKESLKTVNLTYGIGDHFLMSDDYLKDLVKSGINFIEEAGYSGTYSSVFVSTSLIGKKENVLRKLDILSKMSSVKRVPVIPLVVFDPVKLYKEKFWDRYIDTILIARDKFDRVDLAINISDDVVKCLKPEELINFAIDHKFDDVTINWVPSKFNFEYTSGNISAISNWLIEFGRLSAIHNVESSYNPVIDKLIKNFYKKEFDKFDSFKRTVYRSIQIDHAGNLLPKFEAVGDIPGNDRVGFEDFGNIKDHSIEKLLDKNIRRSFSNVLKLHSGSGCSSCEYYDPCTMAGFHAYNHVLPKSESGCSHVAKKLFEERIKDAVNE